MTQADDAARIADADWAVRDLHDVVRLGEERLGDLLTVSEKAVCKRILALSGPPARTFARLSARKPAAVRVTVLEIRGVPDPQAACDVLVAAGLLGEGATWRERLLAVRVPILRMFCREHGLVIRGRRAELVERLWDLPEIPAAHRWVHRPHTALVRRLERAAFLDKRADRGQLVAERLGHVTWPDYTPTGGPGLWRDRDHLLRWEAAWQACEEGTLTPGQALVALQRGDGEAPGRLSLLRRLSECVMQAATTCRREGRPLEALAVLDALRVALDGDADALCIERSRCLEDAGQPQAALSVLSQAVETTTGARRLAVNRSGRRLALSLHTAWPPDPPLSKPRERTLRLAAHTPDHRPRWSVGGASHHVEDAVIAHLAEAGRGAVRAEGGLLRTLFALLFADAILAPVRGQLPVPRLPGPLDLGRPAFAARRPALVQRALDGIAAGEGPDRVAAAAARFEGVRLAGVSRDLSDPTPLVAAARALGPRGLRAVLGPMLAEGWRAARGLPDLLVLDGPDVHLTDSSPRKLGAGGRLVEVKGPGDTLSDAQRVWLHRLARAGVPAEVWRVKEG